METESGSDSGMGKPATFVDVHGKMAPIRLGQPVDARRLLEHKLKHLQNAFFTYDHFNKSFYLTHQNTMPFKPHS